MYFCQKKHAVMIFLAKTLRGEGRKGYWGFCRDATLNEVAVYFAKVYIYLPISVYNPILFRISLSENIHHGAITYRGVSPSQTIFFQKRFANSK